MNTLCFSLLYFVSYDHRLPQTYQLEVNYTKTEVTIITIFVTLFKKNQYTPLIYKKSMGIKIGLLDTNSHFRV